MPLHTPHQREAPGFILWFTGRPCSGKTSLGVALREALAPTSRIHLLDGDELRHTLSRDLTFSRADRFCQAERAGYVARLLASHGVGAIVATISPYAEARALERERARQAGVQFLEVFVDADLATLEARDSKGLYARVRQGEALALTGVSDPYEPPEHPDLHLRTDRETLPVSLGRILTLLRSRGLWESVA